MSQIKGLPASPGIAIGSAWVYRPVDVNIVTYRIDDPELEWGRVEAALEIADGQLQRLERQAQQNIGAEEAAIFEAHQLFLQDPDLLELIQGIIDAKRVNGETAVSQAIETYAQELEAIEDEYFKARAADIRDVGQRLIRCLLGISPETLLLPDMPVIILADDLTPSDTVQFNAENVLGLGTVRGGPTAHTAILARSLGIPAVVSAPLDLDNLANGTMVILNGETGEITLDPTEGMLETAVNQQARWKAQFASALSVASDPAITQDNHQVEVVANIGNVADAQLALQNGAEGVGLFRTEFLYLDRDRLPTEAEQVAAYGEVMRVMGKRPFVVRTLDIGGDKAVSYLGLTDEANPFLGWRAIRMIDERPEILYAQLRALLQAGVATDLRIMLPLISSIGEIRQAKEILHDAQNSLNKAGIPTATQIQFGIMVEVPSAALLAAQFAQEVDFFSIGTNDLTQYTLAVDRTNERVAKLASPFHPAVLRLIQITIEAAHAHGKWVGLCGEFAGNPLAVPLLLGLGLDEFSMAPGSIPMIKELIRQFSLVDCKKMAAQALSFASTDEVRRFLHSIQR